MEWIDCSDEIKSSERGLRVEGKHSLKLGHSSRSTYLDDSLNLDGCNTITLNAESMGWNKPVHFGIAKMETLTIIQMIQ